MLFEVFFEGRSSLFKFSACSEIASFSHLSYSKPRACDESFSRASTHQDKFEQAIDRARDVEGVFASNLKRHESWGGLFAQEIVTQLRANIPFTAALNCARGDYGDWIASPFGLAMTTIKWARNDENKRDSQ